MLLESLPALYSPVSSTWTSGFPAITSRLRYDAPPTFRDPDQTLSPTSRAEAVAYSAYLRRAAGPLLALSLYVSPSNWSLATRPAYSAILPPPLGWTESPGVRATWVASAAHLGLPNPDGARSGAGESEGDDNSRTDADGWLRVPKSLRSSNAAARETAASAAERRARSRLDELAGDVLDVLDALRGDKRWFLDPADTAAAGWDVCPSSLDCLAFGYLSLMLVPELPRPWLREAMRRRYGRLCSFVGGMRATCLPRGGLVAALPWSADKDRADGPAPGVLLRFADGAVRNMPGLGPQWLSWWLFPWAKEDREEGGAADILVALGGILTAAAVATGFVYRKDIFPFGAPIQRWERPQIGLRNFGAAGAMFGLMEETAIGGA